MKFWRDRAAQAAREATLAARALDIALATKQFQPQDLQPLPVGLARIDAASEELIYNIEETRRFDRRFVIRGWAFLKSSPDCRQTLMSCLVHTPAGAFALPLHRSPRPDVAAAFPDEVGGTTQRSNSGFFGQFDCKFMVGGSVSAFLVLQHIGTKPHFSSPIPLGK